jgi:glycosyltransferase involved in cell wall biosynthesis
MLLGMTSKASISWYSNSLNQPTGYGTQSKQVIQRLVADGHKVAMLSNYGSEGVNTTIETGVGLIPQYSRGMTAYSTDVLPLHHAHWSAENSKLPSFLITLYDTWVLLDNPALDSIPIASWTPIDHQPAPENVLKWLRKPNVTPIAMSRFGQRMIEQAGLESEYIPHAIDTKVFKPTEFLPEGITGREFVGGEDNFVVGMNFANKAGGFIHRKAVAENFLAFAIFAQKHDDVILYLHTEPYGKQSGFNLPQILAACGVPPEKVKLIDPIAYQYGISQETLVAIYSAWDVGLFTSYGEGFGVPSIEVQACGVPIIASNFAASAELVSKDGFLVGGQPLWDAGQGSWYNVPNVQNIVDSLEQAYQRGKKDFPDTIAFAKDYDADKVYQESWKPLIKKLSEK